MRHVIHTDPDRRLFAVVLFCLAVCALGILATLYLLTVMP